MPHIRKARAGNDSFGNEWPEDGAVVDVPVEQAAELVAIPDGGFSEASAPGEPATQDDGGQGDAETGSSGDTGDEQGDGEKTEIDEAPKPARRGRKPKAETDKTVEE
jgi:hypothetical protein